MRCCLVLRRFQPVGQAVHHGKSSTQLLPNEWRPLSIREVCLFPRYPQTMPYHMTYYGVNALELCTQRPDMTHVVKVDTLLQPWHESSHHHKRLWRKLYSQTAQDSNVRTEFKTIVAHNSKDEPHTTITFEDGQVLTLKTANLEYDYMMYITVREIAEKAMKAASFEDAKI